MKEAKPESANPPGKLRVVPLAIQNALGWREEDAKSAIRSATLLFLIVAAFVLLKTIRDTSFLVKYSASTLAQYMALNTLASGAVGFLLLRLYKFISLRRLLQAGLLIFATGTLVFWKAFPVHFTIDPKIFYLWVGIYGTIIPVQAWSLVSLQLSARQAKRTLGWVASGAILGGIAGGLLAGALVNKFGLHSLFPSSVLVMILAFAFSPTASGSLTETTPPSTEPLNKKKIAPRYLLFLIIIVAIGTIVSTFLDFQFKAYTQREYQNETALGSFLGTFYAVLGVTSLIFQIFITPFILKRIGLTAGLAAMPFFLLLGSGTLYVRKSFSAIVMLRGSEELLRHSLDRSSFEVLQLAMPAYQKMKLKSLVDTIGIRASELIGCLILILLFTSKELPLSTLTIFNIILTFIWFVFALLLGLYEYPKRLKDYLRIEEIDFSSIQENLFSQEFHRTLPALLSNAPKDTVMRILELLENSDRSISGRDLTSLTNNDSDVRQKTLQLLFLQKEDMTQKVKPLLSDSDPRVRAEAIHYLLVRTSVPNKLQPINKDESLAVQAALCTSGLKLGSKESQEEIESILKVAETQKDEFALQEIAHLIQFETPSDFSLRIYKRLLSIPLLEVRKAALKSIGFTKPKDLIPILLKLTRVPELKTEVRVTLARYGQTLVPFLEEIILNSGESTPRRKLALKIAADVGGVTILDSVLKIAQDRDISLRFSAIKTLNYFRIGNLFSSDHPSLPPLLDQEISTLETERKRAILFESEPNSLIQRILSQRILWATQRIFRILGLIFPPDDIYHAYLAWNSNDEKKRDTGLELLEHTLTPDFSKRLLPLLENASSEPTHEVLKKNRAEAFRSFLDEKDPLLIAAAILELDETEWNHWSGDVNALQEERSVLLKETIQRRTTPMAETDNKTLTLIEKIEYLTRIDLFSHLSPPELLLISEVATEAKFEVGTTLYREGDPPAEIMSLIRGRVELVRQEESVGWIEPGESFGTLEILTGKTRVSSAIVRETAFCLRISGETFWEILEDYTPVSRGVIETLAEKIETLMKEQTEMK